MDGSVARRETAVYYRRNIGKRMQTQCQRCASPFLFAFFRENRASIRIATSGVLDFGNTLVAFLQQYQPDDRFFSAMSRGDGPTLDGLAVADDPGEVMGGHGGAGMTRYRNQDIT